MIKHILIVGGRVSLHKRLQAVGGLRTTVICRQSMLHKIAQVSHHDRILALEDTANIQKWVDLACGIHSFDPFSGIGAFHEYDQEKAAAIGEMLGLHYHSVNTVSMVQNKVLMRQRLNETRVDMTPCRLVATKSEVAAFAQEVGYPIILKIVDGSGSTGIAAVHHYDDIEQALTWSITSHEGVTVMAEPMHVGSEFSVEMLSENGQHQLICVTEKFREERHFVELGHVLPASLPSEEVEKIRIYVSQVLDALDIKFVPTHTELVLTVDGPRIIETHVRLGGDSIPRVIENALHVNISALVAEQVAGLSIASKLAKALDTSVEVQAGAVWFVTPQANGEITQIEHIEDAQIVQGVTEIELLKKAGDMIEGLTLKNSFSRAASCCAVGSNRDEALGAAKRALGKLVFHVRAKNDL